MFVVYLDIASAAGTYKAQCELYVVQQRTTLKNNFYTIVLQFQMCFKIVDEGGHSEVDCTWEANLVEELDTQTSKTEFQKFADEINQLIKEQKQ